MRWGIGDRWIPKHIAEAPHRFDVMNSTSGLSKFFLERANKDVNDLELRLVHPAVEVVEDWLHKFKATIGLSAAKMQAFAGLRGTSPGQSH